MVYIKEMVIRSELRRLENPLAPGIENQESRMF